MSLKSIWCFIVNFDYISHLFLAFLLLTLNKIKLAVNIGLKTVGTKSILWNFLYREIEIYPEDIKNE